MKTTPIQCWSVSKGEFSEPPPKPNHSSGSGLHPSFIAMVRAQPFSGQYNEFLLMVINSHHKPSINHEKGIIAVTTIE
jgi:hypothetical protein